MAFFSTHYRKRICSLVCHGCDTMCKKHLQIVCSPVKRITVINKWYNWEQDSFECSPREINVKYLRYRGVHLKETQQISTMWKQQFSFSSWISVSHHNGFNWKTYPSPLKCYFPSTFANWNICSEVLSNMWHGPQCGQELNFPGSEWGRFRAQPTRAQYISMLSTRSAANAL